MTHPMHHFPRTAEHVGCGHPDKFADQVADHILDESLRLCGEDHASRQQVRTAIECLVKDRLLVISGEAKWPDGVGAKLLGLQKGLREGADYACDVLALAQRVWHDVGYDSPNCLSVLNHIRPQSPDIAKGSSTPKGQTESEATGTDFGGAGDQGIMVGYATDETPEFMPQEWILARNLILRLNTLRRSRELSWLKSDCKSQVTLSENNQVTSVILAAQHADRDDPVYGGALKTDDDLVRFVRKELFEHVIRPELEIVESVEFQKQRFRCGSLEGAINGTGKFTIGGPLGDAGVVGRKLVVDAYGPQVPVGGGAYSGKDPTKVDRSAAYMARHIAKNVVAHRIGGARACTVKIAYGIGQLRPEMVTAVTHDGQDVSEWVKAQFRDLSPRAIIDEHLGLLRLDGWSYAEAAVYGHYGREQFPWERICSV